MVAANSHFGGVCVCVFYDDTPCTSYVGGWVCVYLVYGLLMFSKSIQNSQQVGREASKQGVGSP